MNLLKNKKAILSILGLLIIIGGTVAGFILVKKNQEIREEAAPATTLRFSPPSISKNPGDSFDISVQINTSGSGSQNSVTVYKTVITFNPAIFEVTSVQKSPFAASLNETIPGVDKTDNTEGKITTQAHTLNKDNALKGEGELLRISGKVKDTATAGSYSFEFASDTKIAGLDEGGVNLLTDKSSGGVIVLAPADASPSPSPSPSPSAAPTGVSPSPSASPSPSPSASPIVSPSPSASPATGGAASPLPSPSPSPSTAPASGGTTASPSPSASPAGAVTKPTVTLPANKTVTAGSTLSGTAAPNATVTITIQSDPITASVKADSAGKWSYTIPSSLAAGTHTITVTDSKGTYTTTFTVSGTQGGTTTPSGETPVAGFSLPTYLAIGAGFLLIIFGALLAF